MNTTGIAASPSKRYAAPRRASKAQVESFQAKLGYCENKPVRGTAWFCQIHVPLRMWTQTSGVVSDFKLPASYTAAAENRTVSTSSRKTRGQLDTKFPARSDAAVSGLASAVKQIFSARSQLR